MIPAILGFLKRFLYDEAAAQRYAAMACFLIGDWLASGGVIPGTSYVLPIPDAINFSSKGALMKGLALYLGAGGVLPTGNIAEHVEAAKNGNGKTPPP